MTDEVKSALYSYSMEMISLIEETRALGVNPKQEERLMDLEKIAKGLKTLYDDM